MLILLIDHFFSKLNIEIGLITTILIGLKTNDRNNEKKKDSDLNIDNDEFQLSNKDK